VFEISVFLRERLVARSTFAHEEVRIGRSPDNELQLDDPVLSRFHASIETQGGVAMLKDLGSMSGTFVNAERVVGKRSLGDGDRIGVGRFNLIFRTERPVAVTTEIGDEAAFVVAGATMHRGTAEEARERTCPIVGYLQLEPPDGDRHEGEPPRYFPLARDIFVIGSGPEADLVTPGPERAAAITRSFRGFSVIALAPGVEKNGQRVELVTDLRNGDGLTLGPTRYRYRAGRPEASP
jgi:predicted component of type VI protein secretion system